MKLLNWGIGILLVLVVLFLFRKPIEPPNDEWFQSAVIEPETPVLVKFGADWCGPCRQMEPMLDQVQEELSGRVKIVRIDVDEKPNLASHYGINAIPRVYLFEKGKIVGQSYGFDDAADLKRWIERRIH